MAIDFGVDPDQLRALLRAQGFGDAEIGRIVGGSDAAARQQSYDTVVGELVPQLGAVDVANIQGQQDAVRQQYLQGVAQNDFTQGNAQQNYGVSRGNLVRQFDQMRQKLPYSYNARGLMNSGVYQQGLQDYADNRLRGLGQFDLQHQQNMSGLALQRQGLEGSYRTSMDNLQRADKARRAQLAAQIKAVQ